MAQKSGWARGQAVGPRLQHADQIADPRTSDFNFSAKSVNGSAQWADKDQRFLGPGLSAAKIHDRVVAAHNLPQISRSSKIVIHAAIEQLLPSAVAGTLITFVLVRFAPESLWMLPGLWQILFSLGIFASCRLLPKALFAVGAWYLASGLVCLAVGGNAWSPLAMGIPFGLGQLMMAAILHHALGGVDGED